MNNKKLTTSLVASFFLATTNLYSQELSEITITSATKSEQSIKDVTANVEVITKEEIEEKHFTNVSDALRTLSSISIVSNGGIGQKDDIFIRGIDTKRILILIDGIRYNEPTSTSGAPLSLLNIDDVEQIEIIKGAQSGIWGADASGGVINIITKSAKKGLHGTVGLESGSNKTRKIYSTISSKNELGYIKLNASRLSTDGISAYEPNGSKWDDLGLERDYYNNNTYSINGGIYLNENDEISSSFKKIYSKYAYDSTTSDNSTKFAKMQHYFKSLNYIHKKESYQLKLNAQQSRFDRIQGTTTNVGLVNEFSIQSDYQYLKKDTFIFGLNKQNFEDIKNKRKYNTKAIFISNSNNLDKLSLNESIRYDNNSKYEEKITGKFGVKYNIDNDTSIFSNIGTAYNAPTLSNLSYTPSLLSESTNSMDLNLKYKDFRITYFQNEIKNMINYSYSGGFHYYNEDGISKFKGIELSYNKNIFSNTLFNVNYTKMSAKDNSNNYIKRIPLEQLNTSVDYYGIKNVHLNLSNLYIGERYDDSSKTEKTGNYSVWNGVINYDINSNVKTYVKIDNIFDKYYQTAYDYASPGRSLYMGLKVSF